ncbi:hypothetical protein ACFX14_038878 [Malus domestica]
MSLPSLLDRQDSIEVCAVEAIPDDWRKPIMQYLDNPNGKHGRKTRVHAHELCHVSKRVIPKRRGRTATAMPRPPRGYSGDHRSP